MEPSLDTSRRAAQPRVPSGGQLYARERSTSCRRSFTVIGSSIHPFFHPSGSDEVVRQRESIASLVRGLMRFLPTNRPPILLSSCPSIVGKIPLTLSLVSSFCLSAPGRTVTWLPTDTYLSLPLTFDMNNVCQVSTQPPLRHHRTCCCHFLPQSPPPSLFAALFPPTLRTSASSAFSPGRCLSSALPLSALANGEPSARPRLERRGRERHTARLPADQGESGTWPDAWWNAARAARSQRLGLACT